MTIENILSFVYVYRCNGFHKAAQALYVTQPSLSSRIRTLEREVNAALLVRRKNGVELTEAGKTFLPYALQIVSAYTEAQSALYQGSGSIVIGTNISISITILPHVLRSFQQKYPRASIEIMTNMPDALLSLLRDKQCDFLITQRYELPDLIQTPVYQDRISLVVPSGHPFLRRNAPPDFSEVALEPIVCISAMANYWAIIKKHFESRGVSPGAALSVDSVDVAKNMVLRGMGVAFLPELALESELMKRELHIVAPTPPLIVTRDIHLIHRVDEAPPCRDFFVDLCRQYRGWNDAARNKT